MKRAKLTLASLILTLATAGGGAAIAQAKPAIPPTSSDQQDALKLETPAIGYDQAVQNAEAYVKTGTATSATLEDENGSLVYAIEIGGLDVKVDAMTGSVLRVDNGNAE